MKNENFIKFNRLERREKKTVYEEDGKLYVSDNFTTFGEKIDIDRWLSVYKIFFGEDKTFTLTKSEKKLFKMGVYNN